MPRAAMGLSSSVALLMWLVVGLVLWARTAQTAVPSVVAPAVTLARGHSASSGEQLLRELRENVGHFGDCWRNAVETLETSCGSLTETSQHRLALAFTSCFVQKMGHAGYSCPNAEPLEQCGDFRQLSANSPHLGTYSTFFTHAHVICAFLEQQRWQSTTLDVIGALSETSTELSGRLMSLNEVVASTREDQDRLYEHTQQALVANQELSSRIASQGSSLSVMLDQIQYVNSVIAGHASTLSSFAYFLAGVLISFLLTTPEQTRQVRFWLLLLFTANLLIELAILQWALEVAGLTPDYFKASSSSSNPISWRVSLCRRLFCCLSFVVYLYKAITYRSPEERSHCLLLEMSSMVGLLDKRLQRIESALTSAAARVRKSHDYDHTDGQRRLLRGSSPPFARFRESTPLGALPRANPTTMMNRYASATVSASSSSPFSEQQQQQRNGGRTKHVNGDLGQVRADGYYRQPDASGGNISTNGSYSERLGTSAAAAAQERRAGSEHRRYDNDETTTTTNSSTAAERLKKNRQPPSRTTSPRDADEFHSVSLRRSSRLRSPNA